MSTESANSEQGPKPVRDEPGLGLLDALVAAERASASMVPPADGERQTWKRVAASVAVGGPPPVQPSSISDPATTVTALWVKIVLGVIVSGVLAAAGYRLANNPEPAAMAKARSSTEPRKPPPSPPLPSAAPRAGPPAPQLPAAVVTPESPPALVQHEAAPPRKAPVAPPAPHDPPASDLAEETRLLARARARLRGGSPSDALTPLTEHTRRFPKGQLTEDRMVLRARALCESGNTKAGRQEASALRRAFPKSSHLPRVNRSCRP